jgi:hypothetical protein
MLLDCARDVINCKGEQRIFFPFEPERRSVGVRVAETLHVKKLDEDFFSEE